MLETEPKIIQSYVASGKVRLVYRHILQLGEGSDRSAAASECAADQGKFWPMHDLLYAHQQDLSRAQNFDATLAGYAKDLGLDTAAFGKCMQANTHWDAILADYRAARSSGVLFRPTFDLNGERFTGALPLETFQKRIDAALAK